MTDAKLLNDEQVRAFIANGFLQLTPDVDPSTHVEIEALLRFAMEKEGWYGNNILSRIPKMYQVLNCPVVRGALESLAGPDYYIHPHRQGRTQQHAGRGSHCGVDAGSRGARNGQGFPGRLRLAPGRPKPVVPGPASRA